MLAIFSLKVSFSIVLMRLDDRSSQNTSLSGLNTSFSIVWIPLCAKSRVVICETDVNVKFSNTFRELFRRLSCCKFCIPSSITRSEKRVQRSTLRALIKGTSTITLEFLSDD